ncbi:FAD dependent oxidoreductase [Diplogelasinospora grovesii]|uniref:FAD dependent oxidoreductase n=1 Tax=Diplogelasinospora grovesii TaxID=303347 RepID=A0AAN6NDV8_9PEZI|nr:FAD dependent oxidoreductase [Diplogelasinospora grovesii]
MSSTVILGSGIIGVSTAYYLSDHQPASSIHLVESAPELFSSASGYAGGFLAKDWFRPAVAPLGALSFDLHRQLAEENGGREKWGYSRTTCISYAVSAVDKASQKRGDDWLRDGTSRAETAPAVLDDSSGMAPTWLRRVSGDQVELISEDGTTAQVDPLQLCQFLLQECLKRGVRLHHPAAAVSVSTDVRNELSSIRIADSRSSTETDLPCTRLIITAGAWSGRVFESLFRHSQLRLPISSLAGHSVVLTSPRWHKELEDKGCHAIYTAHTSGYCPEIFSRLGGQIYLAGLNSSAVPLPDTAGQSKIDSAAIASLKAMASELLGPEVGEDDLETVREGLCFRPVTASGTPIVSRIPDRHLGVGMTTRPGADGGVFIAAGHGPWGISMSLGTGKVLAEMAQGRPLSADCTPTASTPSLMLPSATEPDQAMVVLPEVLAYEAGVFIVKTAKKVWKLEESFLREWTIIRLLL